MRAAVAARSLRKQLAGLARRCCCVFPGQRNAGEGSAIEVRPRRPLRLLACGVAAIIALRWLYYEYLFYALYHGVFYAPHYVRWAAYEQAARLEPRFRVSLDEVRTAPAWVISLPRAVERRTAVMAEMHAANHTFAWFDGLDGYAAYRGEGTPGAMARAYWSGPRKAPTILGTSLSHNAVLARLVADAARFGLVFEDDFVLHPGFQASLHAVLSDLPASWDMLLLTNFESNIAVFSRDYATVAWGRRVSPRARHLRASTAVLGYVVTHRGALRLLAHCAGSMRIPGDVEFQLAMRHGDVRAYLADPPLITWQEHHKASIVNGPEAVAFAKAHGLGKDAFRSRS